MTVQVLGESIQILNPPGAASDRFQLALRDGHELTTKVEVLSAFDNPPIDITPYWDSGSIRVTSQDIRRAGSLTFADRGDGTNIIPRSPDDLLAPYGNELRIWSGIIFPDRIEEYTPVGVLRITKTTAKFPDVTVEVSDRAWIVQGARLEDSFTIPKGTNYTDAIRSLLIFAYPQVTYDLVDVDDTTPLIIIDAQEDPWSHLRNMAAAVGCTIYFDQVGVCIMRPVQDAIDLDPIWIYDGKPNAGFPYNPDDWANLALYDEEIAWDTEDAHNAVIAIGESASVDVVIRGVAFDTDPGSPTRYGGPFGKRPLFWSSPLLTTTSQAVKAARTRLQGEIGIAETLRIPAMSNPLLDADKIIKVVRPELSIDTLHILDAFDLPLGLGASILDTRQRRVILGQ